MANTKTKTISRNKIKTMAYGFKNRFQNFGRNAYQRVRNSYKKPYRKFNSFSMQKKTSLLTVIIVAVLVFVFKDKISPLVNKLTGKKA